MYEYWAQIVIDNTKVGEDNANFTFLFSGVYDGTGGEPDLRTVTNGGHVHNTDAAGGASGNITVPADLAFSLVPDSATKLDFEVEHYNAATGELIAWVRSGVSATADTVLYLVYGDASVLASQENTAGTWDTNFKMVQHMQDVIAPVNEISNALSGLPNDAAWQGVATDGTYFYVLTSVASGDRPNLVFENIIRKYRIIDGQLMATKNNAYSDTYVFSSGNVIDGKLYIAIRLDGTSDWNHIVVYRLSDLAQLEDHSVALANYRFAEGVDKYDGHFWVVYGGGVGSGNSKCAIAKFNSSWVHQATYDLFVLASDHGYQDIVWRGDDVYLNIHEGGMPEYGFDTWHWTGSGFTRIAHYPQFNDDAGNLAGQGFCYLGGYWYFACRYSDRIVKADLTGSGSLQDSTANDNCLGLKGGDPVFQQEGKVGYAIDFDGNDYVARPATASLDFNGTANITMSTWVNTDTLTGPDANKRTFVILDRDGTSGVLLRMQGSTVEFYVKQTGTGNFQAATKSSALVIGQWIHLCGTYDGSVIRVYVNGVAGTPNSQVGTIVQDETDVELGGQEGVNRYLDGTLDEVRVSNIARSANYVTTTHNSQNSPGTFYSIGGTDRVRPCSGPSLPNMIIV